MEVDLAPLVIPTPTHAFPKHDLIVIFGEPSRFAEGIHTHLKQKGHQVKWVVSGEYPSALGEDLVKGDVSSPETLPTLPDLLGKPGQRVGGIINLIGLSVSNHSMDVHLSEAKYLFQLLKMFQKDLEASANEGGGILVNVTGLDGYLGFRNPRPSHVGGSGTIGLIKSVAREWAKVRIKCIDINPDLDPQVFSRKVVEEIFSGDGEEEIGLNQDGRWKVQLRESGLVPEHVDDLKLNPESVVLILGGAQGITAEIGKALAKTYKPQLVIVGRNVFPGDESPDTAGFLDAEALRHFLIRSMKSADPTVTPTVIETRLKTIMKQREMRANILAMRQAGSKVIYHSLDVRNTVRFANLVDSLYTTAGGIQGVIHGAGIIDDKLIGKKTLDSFERVFETKVNPASVLVKHLRPKGLKFVWFFSSIAARWGNAGQTDYCAANEVLNKMAGMLSQAWPEVRVVSFNWGPWSGGMVNADLQKLFQSRGIPLISMEKGVEFCLNELHRGPGGSAEVLISSPVNPKQFSSDRERTAAY